MGILEEEKKLVQKVLSEINGDRNFEDNYIGNGHTGSVWKISEDLCLKIMPRSMYKEIPKQFRECENLCVPLRTELSESGNYIGNVQEFLNLPNLQYFIKEKRRLSENQAASIIFDILNGLKVLHENGYVHRDFYPGNVMLTRKDKKIKAVIIDFDEMQKVSKDTKACFQYSGYQAPEIVYNNDIYDDKSEMFTVGVIFWELLFGECNFGGYDFFGKVIANSWDEYAGKSEFYNSEVKKALKSLPECIKKINGISVECKDLLVSLLNWDRSKRITAKEAMNYAFFEKTLGKEDRFKKINHCNKEDISR